MNATELHIGVNLGVQKVASNINDDFLPQEIDYYLNESVKDYIKQQYSSIKVENRNIESQYVNENLRTLIATAEISPVSVVDYLPNAVQGDIPSDYLYYIFSRTKNDSSWYNNRRLESKGIKNYIETESNSPIFREFPLLIEGDKLTVIGNATEELDTDTTLRLTYIKKPSKVDVVNSPSDDLDLPEHTHLEIVNITVDKILTVIQGRRE